MVSEQETITCKSTCGPWSCSKAASHSGDHAKMNEKGEVIAEWKGSGTGHIHTSPKGDAESPPAPGRLEFLEWPGKQDDTTPREMAVAVGVFTIAWLPIAMYFTDTLIPALAALDSVADGLGEWFASSMDQGSTGETGGRSDSDTSDIDSPGAIVIAGVLEIIFGIALLAFVFMILATVLLAVIYYLWIVVVSPIYILRNIQAYRRQGGFSNG